LASAVREFARRRDTGALPRARCGGQGRPGGNLEKHARFPRLLSLLGEALTLGQGGLILHAGSRGDSKLALAFQDGSAKIARQRRAELRRAGTHLAIVAGQTGETVGRRLAFGVVKLLALLADPHPWSLERQPGHAKHASAGERRDADQQLALEANGAARCGFEDQGLRVMLGRRRSRGGSVRHVTLP